MTTTDIDAIRPATDLLLANLRETLGQVREHDHPASGGDLFCLNLTSYMGDRMGPVLRRLADEQADTKKWRERNTALADEFTAEVDRLNAKVDELTAELAANERSEDARLAIAEAELEKVRAQLTAANRRNDGLQADLDSATKANTAWANETAAKDAVIEAAKTWRRAVTETGDYEISDSDVLIAAIDALPKPSEVAR